MSQERRVHTRFSIALAAEISTGSHRFTATTKDISAGGCCIAGPYPLREGAEVLCSLYVVVDGIEEANLPPLETRATVQWHADTEDADDEGRHLVGLRFAALSPQHVQWLEATIARGQG